MAAAMVLLATLLATLAASPNPDDSAVDYYLFDSRNVASQVGVRLTLGALRKEASNPLIKEDRPWEKLINSGYPNVLFDDEEKLYKMWYGCQLYCPHHRKAGDCPHRSYNYTLPGSDDDEGDDRQGSVGNGAMTGSCYATSVDGIRWEKPSLGVVEWNHSSANNIVMKTAADNGRGFMKDLHETNASQRYKMFGQVAPFCLRSAVTGECMRSSPALNGSTDPALAPLAIALGTSVSADGIRWEPNISISAQVNAAADASNQILWDEQTQRYFGLTRIDLFSSTGQYREGAITTSRDWRHWSRAVETIHNNISERGGKHPREENTYIVFRPEGNANVWLSLVTFAEGPKLSWGRFVTELAWSTDLFVWHRICPGTSFIPLGGNNGSWDQYMTVAAAAPLPDAAEPTRTRVYYVGMNGPWKSSRGEHSTVPTVQCLQYRAHSPASLAHLPSLLTHSRAVTNEANPSCAPPLL